MSKKPRQRPATILVNHRLKAQLVERMRSFVAEEMNEYGEPRYRSQTAFVEEAIVKNLPRTAAKHRST